MHVKLTRTVFFIFFYFFCLCIPSFGLTPAAPLQVMSPLAPGMTAEASLTLATTGAVQRMEPLTNLQVCIYCVFWIYEVESSFKTSIY